MLASNFPILTENEEELNQIATTCMKMRTNTCAYICSDDKECNLTTFSTFPIHGRCHRICAVLVIVQTKQTMSPELFLAFLQDTNTDWKRMNRTEKLRRILRCFKHTHVGVLDDRTDCLVVAPRKSKHTTAIMGRNKSKKPERVAVMYDKDKKVLMIHPALFHWINNNDNNNNNKENGDARGNVDTCDSQLQGNSDGESQTPNIMGQDPRLVENLIRYLTDAENTCIVRSVDMFIQEKVISPTNTLCVNPDAIYLRDFFSPTIYATVMMMASMRKEATDTIVQSAQNNIYKLDCISIYGENDSEIIGYAFTWKPETEKDAVKMFTGKVLSANNNTNALVPEEWIRHQVSHVNPVFTFNEVGNSNIESPMYEDHVERGAVTGTLDRTQQSKSAIIPLSSTSDVCCLGPVPVISASVGNEARRIASIDLPESGWGRHGVSPKRRGAVSAKVGDEVGRTRRSDDRFQRTFFSLV